MLSLAFCALLSLSLPPVSPSGDEGLTVDVESYTLPNGMRITLYQDHSLPKVVINTWFTVGSKDEVIGRTGFAHLFEHLMFMGTERVPGSQFDVIMESGGGFNNATTSQDRTNYYSQGPSSLLPTLIWLDADRFEALDDAMTVEKLDAQREIVRNERRQSGENVPYGRARLMMPGLLYPEGHPYRHSVIGSHEDLEAAALEDVIGFFRNYYVPGNASLVIAGDFDRDQVVDLIENTMGQLEAKPVPKHNSASPVSLPFEKRAITYDDVKLPKLILAWHSPGYMTDGDGAMDVISSILAGGSASRLEKRLVNELGLAQEVRASQGSAKLGSIFSIDVTAAADADLDAIKAEVLKVIDELAAEGGDAERASELARVQAQLERGFLQRNEDLLRRADAINRYIHYWDVTDGFARDLARWTSLAVDDVRLWASRVFGEGRLDMRVLPTKDKAQVGELVELPPVHPASESVASLDDRPANFTARSFEPPKPTTHTLSNGIEVVMVERPGTKLFSGVWMIPGGESRVPNEHAGLSTLIARTMTQGSHGKDASDWTQEVESIGASIGVSAGREQMLVRFSGLTSKFSETLEFFRQAALSPNLDAEDLQRERTLMIGDIQRRADNPRSVAGLVSRALLFGSDTYRGRPLDGNEETLTSLGNLSLRPSGDLDWLFEESNNVDQMNLVDQGSIRIAYRELVHSNNSTFVVVGDFDSDYLLKFLESRFGVLDSGSVRSENEEGNGESARPNFLDTLTPPAAPLVEASSGRTILVDKPGAPQTVVYILRPMTKAESVERAIRTCLDTALGGSFTSRLNMNLREKNGYSYGAGSRINQEGDQVLMLASSSVRTDVTGVALTEFSKEFDALASGDVSEEELAKAIESSRTDVMGGFGTTGAIAATFSSLISNGRPLDSKRAELSALDHVALGALNELARSGIYEWGNLQVVLVGDAEAVLPQLTEAGFPAPVRADADGNLID